MRQAPVAFELVSAGGGQVRVRVYNKETFGSTSDLRLRWRLMLDGAPLPLAPAKPSADGYCPVGDVDIPAQVRPCLPLTWPDIAMA